MLVIPAGRFQMGDSQKIGVSYEQPVHTVTIPYSFAMSQFEITFADYDRYSRATGKPLASDYRWGRDKRPVIHVNQQDARRYAQWLTAQTGHVYRLPTESEWEYAARAGTTTAYPWGNKMDKVYANCYDCDEHWLIRKTLPVGTFPPNAWGLYDTQGNVWEMTADCWHFSYAGAPDDGSAWRQGDCSRIVLRGGSFGDHAVDLRSATRLRSYAGTRTIIIGFRLVRELD